MATFTLTIIDRPDGCVDIEANGDPHPTSMDDLTDALTLGGLALQTALLASKAEPDKTFGEV